LGWSGFTRSSDTQAKGTAMTPAPRTRLARPDLSDRPHQLTVERDMKAPPAAIYRSWTEQFDSWFAAPRAIRMRAQEDEPFYFETEHEGERHPHYGRLLTLRQDELVELTWVTGMLGTEGAETVVTVELAPKGTGTRLRLTHAGFYDEASAQRHEAWHSILAMLDERLGGT
jgi:uncharacterized protein YndB with AHSA1/START domain